MAQQCQHLYTYSVRLSYDTDMVREVLEESFEAEVIDSGRVTIPSYVREKLGLMLGCKVWITVRRGIKCEICGTYIPLLPEDQIDGVVIKCDACKASYEVIGKAEEEG